MATIEIAPLSFLEKLADSLMVPVMYLLAGTCRETPQQTHFWNNRKLSGAERAQLNDDLMLVVLGDSTAAVRESKFSIRFHAPIFGGWRRYKVLEPLDRQVEPWFVGWWVQDKFAGFSRIPQSGQVRVLRGDSIVSFFGLNAHGEQIMLQFAGEGRIGKGGPSARIPLV